jgi:hypothetical protein
VVATIATVGFGDISASTLYEKIFVILVMLIGVTAFSFATGSLSSLMNNLDYIQAKIKQQIEFLDQIKRDYNIGPALYEEVRQSIKFSTEKDKSALIEFIQTLPF